MRRRALVGMLLVCLVVGMIPISNGVEKSNFSIKVPDELPNGATITDITGYKEIKDEIEDYYPHAIDGRAYDYSDNSVICILVFSSVTDAQKDFKHSFSTFSELEGGMQFEDFVVYHSEFKQLFDSSSTWIKKNAWIGESDEVTFTLDRYVIFIDPLSIPEGIKIAEMVYSLNQEDSEVTHITTLHDADETGECFDFSQNTKIIISRSDWVDYLAGTEGDLAFDSGTLVAQDETIPHLIVYKEEEIVSKCKEMGVDDESWDRVKDQILSQIYGDLKLKEISVPETGYEKGVFHALQGLIYLIKCKDEKGYAVIRLLEVREEGLGMYKFEWVYYDMAIPTPTTPIPTPTEGLIEQEILDNEGNEIGLKVIIEYPTTLSQRESGYSELGWLDIKLKTGDFEDATFPDGETNLKSGCIMIASNEDMYVDVDGVEFEVAPVPQRLYHEAFGWEEYEVYLRQEMNEWGWRTIVQILSVVPGSSQLMTLQEAFDIVWKEIEYDIGREPVDTSFYDMNTYDIWEYPWTFELNSIAWDKSEQRGNGVHLRMPFVYEGADEHEIHVFLFLEDYKSYGYWPFDRSYTIGKEYTCDINVGGNKMSGITSEKAEIPLEKEKEIPGFEVIFVIMGLLAVTYILRRRK